MRKLLLTTALALPMSFGTAFAQDTPPADPAMEPAQTETTTTEPVAVETETAAEGEADESAAAASAAEKVEMEQAANEWRVDWITGTNVTSPEGESIGSISDLILDGDTGQMKAAIIGVGGFLGIGEKQIALPWAELVINSDAQQISTDLTREEAEAAPEYVFRDRETASGDMVSDPAASGDTTAADPMAAGTETATEPMTTETTTDAMPEAETETEMTETSSDPAAATTTMEPADSSTSNVEVTTVPADEASSEMTEEMPPMEGAEAEMETEVETETETPAN
nr:PRC-barrel domain-containing protein [Paracoccus saliphilus]